MKKLFSILSFTALSLCAFSQEQYHNPSVKTYSVTNGDVVEITPAIIVAPEQQRVLTKEERKYYFMELKKDSVKQKLFYEQQYKVYLDKCAELKQWREACKKAEGK